MIKKFGLLLLMAIYFLIAYTLLEYYDITCVFLEFLKIPCPGCGMTRALVSLLNMDFVEAVKHNVVVFFMPYVFAYIFFDFKGRVHNVLLGLIGIIAGVNWLIKIILFLGGYVNVL
ncbi:MAG: DUF2752 domain-containing protein [Clostridia bacterium]|nr:DUF2752 domain-containing protein [Clostridia bacterium]